PATRAAAPPVWPAPARSRSAATAHTAAAAAVRGWGRPGPRRADTRRWAGVGQSESTRIDAMGVAGATMRFDAVLAVDMAVAPKSGTIAVAQAGVHDPEQPLPTFVGDSGGANVVAPMTAFGPGAGNVMLFVPESMVVGAEQMACTFP